MSKQDKQVKIKDFIEEWRGKIGQEWEQPERNIEDIMSDDIIEIIGWNEDVSWDAIRKYALINMDMNALWLDEEYATKSKWKGIIAPPVFLHSVNLGLDKVTNMTFDCINRGIYEQSFNSAFEWEFFEPVRPGYEITIKSKITDIIEKQGRRGKLCFCIEETTYSNQHGQVLAIKRGTVICVWESKVDKPIKGDK